MKSKTAHVIPLRKYRIKLAVMDFCPSPDDTSAVFFNMGSFDIGDLDLGADLLVENETAVCFNDTKVIHSGLGTDGIDINWYRNGDLMVDEKEPSLEVVESGLYRVVGNYTDLDCEIAGEIVVEFYPAISTIVQQPETINICRSSLNELLLDLSLSEVFMFQNSGNSDYSTRYFETLEDAENNLLEIQSPKTYSMGTNPESKTFYIRVENIRTACYELFTLRVQVEPGEIPMQRGDIKICESYTFPELGKNQYYYTEPAGKGVNYKQGDVLNIPGEHIIYLLQINSDEGCFEESSFKISITKNVKADVFPDLNLDCEKHVLQPLSAQNKYFTKPGGNGEELSVGTYMASDQTIYVFASSDDGLCTDESSYTIRYTDCPIQKGISPNGDGVNDSFELFNHNVTSLKVYNRYGTEVYSFDGKYTNEWGGQSKNGDVLPDGTYYYIIVSHGKTRTGWVQVNR